MSDSIVPKYTTFRDVLWRYGRNLDKISECRKEIDRCHAEDREMYDTIIRVLRREDCVLEHCGYCYSIGADGDLVVKPVKSVYSIELNDPEPDPETVHENETADAIAAHERSLPDLEF